MTVSTSTNSVTYVTTGATNIFDYDFVVYDESHFVITLDGVEVTSGFTVTGVGDESGGTVIFDTNPTGTLVILRQVPFTQDIDYSPYDPFPAEAHERGLDLGVMRDQQLKTAVDQAQADIDSLEVRVGSLVDVVALHHISESLPLGKGYIAATVTPEGDTAILDLTTAAAFRVTLNAPTTHITFTNESGTAGSMRYITLVLRQGTGVNLVEWPSNVRWSYNQQPVLAYEKDYEDVVTLVNFGTDGYWYGFLTGGGFHD